MKCASVRRDRSKIASVWRKNICAGMIGLGLVTVLFTYDDDLHIQTIAICHPAVVRGSARRTMRFGKFREIQRGDEFPVRYAVDQYRLGIRAFRRGLGGLRIQNGSAF